ncbi:MFS transporter [Zeimonas arvi]|uniref:MFS transporter n=2 Tax=Zeimonas arvi TaxID=2498847 RepID=A0A5C8NUR4_9BURK|nr:MFS transporter [Zeimonas arvi]
MLLALTGAFALSQAYRTVAAIMGPPLQRDFGLSPQELGAFAAIFHFAFGALQLAMGIGVDMHGVRRTVLAAFPLTIAGAVLSAMAPSFGWLMLGQALIGVGSAPAFLVCTVFIARQFPAERFAAVSGTVLAIGGVGMLLTGTPLAWLIESWSWRAGFVVLAAMSVLAWLAILRWVREPGAEDHGGVARQSFGDALRGFARLFTMPHTWGILALGAVTYAAFVSLRGLWLGPMLVDRHGFSLVAAGNVAVALTLLALAGPPLFGRFDPGAARRRRILAFTLVLVGFFALMAAGAGPVVDVAASLVLSLLSGFIVLQYSDVRSSYPPETVGRALSLFTMAMFLGVALMQWLTGVVASAAAAAGWPVYGAVFAAIAAMLALGAAAFAFLPQPAGRH